MHTHWEDRRDVRTGPLNRHRIASLQTFALLTVALAVSGCATKGYVRQSVAEAQAANDIRMNALSTDIADTKSRADQAYEKATLAEKLAAGAVDYTVVSTHEMRFAFDDYRLDDEARSLIDAMVASLVARPRGVIEIRGYADADGDDRYNYRLGRERAEAVQRYLATRHTVPPSRIAVMSLGEEEPVAGNESAEGRAQNRRAVARLLELTAKPGDVPVADAQ